MTQFIPLRDRTLAQLAAELPIASRLFREHRLDFCCGGHVTLESVCRERGLDVEEFEKRLSASTAAPSEVLSELTSAALIDVIVTRHHVPVRGELEQLYAMARRVEVRHGDKQDCPHGLAALLDTFTKELLIHMQDEEELLFPVLSTGSLKDGTLIKNLQKDHENYGDWLEKVRALTTDFVPPPEACTTWRALYLRLNALEADLLEHVHLENNLLFPRALATLEAS